MSNIVRLLNYLVEERLLTNFNGWYEITNMTNERHRIYRSFQYFEKCCSPSHLYYISNYITLRNINMH